MFVLTSIPNISDRSGQCNLARKSSILKILDRVSRGSVRRERVIQGSVLGQMSSWESAL